MTCYIVAFEVSSQTTRLKLVEKLKDYKTYCPINTNCWAIVTDQKATQIRDNLTPALEANDKIFVIKSGVEAAWRNVYSTKNSEWLKEKL